MVNDEALNILLDDLAGISRREDQLAILRTWIAERQRETLGKLGGG